MSVQNTLAACALASLILAISRRNAALSEFEGRRAGRPAYVFVPFAIFVPLVS